jgi:hypothetical protein
VLSTHPHRSTVRAAVALANRAPSVHNSQPWRWRVGPSTVHLFADPDRALPATDPEGRDLRLSCGAALHHLRVALAAAGLAARVHLLPDPAHPDHLASLQLHPQAPSDDDLALAAAIERRRSDRRVFSTWPVPAELRDDLRRAAGEQGAQLVVLDTEVQRSAVARLVERAAVEQALTPGVAQETAAWTGRSRVAGDGVPAAAAPPPGVPGVVPARHLGGGELAPAALGRDESDGTVLAVLATRADTPLDQLRAGQALSAVLLTATRHGLATDPVSQPLEVPLTRAGLRTACLGGQGEPQVLLRLGWAPPSAPPLPATGRRPVDETIEDLEQLPGSGR